MYLPAIVLLRNEMSPDGYVGEPHVFWQGHGDLHMSSSITHPVSGIQFCRNPRQGSTWHWHFLVLPVICFVSLTVVFVALPFVFVALVCTSKAGLSVGSVCGYVQLVLSVGGNDNTLIKEWIAWGRECGVLIDSMFRDMLKLWKGPSERQMHRACVET